MPPRKLPRHLVWLESFAAAVESGSLEAAAEHLGVARSVVSEHIRALEQALAEGQPLLERGPGRRLHLTARGEQLYAGTQTPLQQLDLKRLGHEMKQRVLFDGRRVYTREAAERAGFDYFVIGS